MHCVSKAQRREGEGRGVRRGRGGGGGCEHSVLFSEAGRVISFLDSQTARRNDQTEQN